MKCPRCHKEGQTYEIGHHIYEFACTQCIAKFYKDGMVKTNRATLYLYYEYIDGVRSPSHLSANIDNKHLCFPIIEWRYSNKYNRLSLWFRFNGNIWYGQHSRDNIVACRRTKKRA